MSANVSLLNSANSIQRLIQESLGRVHSPERSYSFHKNSLGGQIRPARNYKGHVSDDVKGVYCPGSSAVNHQHRRLIMGEQKSLYARLGGYDAIAAVADNLLPRLMSDPKLGRFWAHRAEDSVRREKQLLIDFLCQSAGGPLFYTGRNMHTSHKGMRIDEEDWAAFLVHLNGTLDAFRVPAAERSEVLSFVESTKADIVEQAVVAKA